MCSNQGWFRVFGIRNGFVFDQGWFRGLSIKATSLRLRVTDLGFMVSG